MTLRKRKTDEPKVEAEPRASGYVDKVRSNRIH